MSKRVNMGTRNRFARGSGVYTCRSCGKRTRDTGESESSVELCAACYHEAGMENEHEDGFHDGAPNDACPYCTYNLLYTVLDDDGNEGYVTACSLDCAEDHAEVIGVTLTGHREPGPDKGAPCDACGGVPR